MNIGRIRITTYACYTDYNYITLTTYDAIAIVNNNNNFL